MKKHLLKAVICLLICSSLASCRDPFEPDLPESQTHQLVVEGYINTGGGITTIKLSRTTPIDEVQREVFETGATVSIESESGERYMLREQGPGNYTSDVLDLDANGKYRLKIKTSTGSEYFSDFVQSLVTPAIDDIAWEEKDGVSIYVSTHDPENKTWYYQWEFEEIWEIQSPIYSIIKYENGAILPRMTPESQKMLKCWRIEKSKEMILGSSAILSHDEINNYKLKSIARHSEVLAHKYTILVKQHALSKEAYNYLQLMTKNTDAVGSLFDPQASELIGNIHSATNPDEGIIGFIGAYTTSEQRLVIDNDELKTWNFDYTMDCGDKMEIIPNDPTSLAQLLKNKIPAQPIYDPSQPIDENTPIVAIEAYLPGCVDCRTRTGNKVPKPIYW